MNHKWRSTEEVIQEFKDKNKDRYVKTLEEVPTEINPQNIIGINGNYSYPDILNDYRMQILKESVNLKGWTNERYQGFFLLMFPNGDLVVNGGGNHRAVLSRELGITLVKAMVAKIVYCDLNKNI